MEHAEVLAVPAGPGQKFTEENLRFLYAILLNATTLTAENQRLIVDAVREIIELLLWEDQQRAKAGADTITPASKPFFEFFLEKQLALYILDVLRLMTRAARSDPTVTQRMAQLLQVLIILFENLSLETSLFTLLSQNYINELISWGAFLSAAEGGETISAVISGLAAEEVLAYYVTLLKTLSMKLSQRTLGFVFNGHLPAARAFPLYTCALPFTFHATESMARIASRTLVLNVFRLDDEELWRFLQDDERSGTARYWRRIVDTMAGWCREMDAVAGKDIATFNAYMADLVDHVLFISDALAIIRGRPLADIVRDLLFQHLVCDTLFQGLSPACDDQPRGQTTQRADGPTSATGSKASIQLSTALILISVVISNLRDRALTSCIINAMFTLRPATTNHLRAILAQNQQADGKPLFRPEAHIHIHRQSMDTRSLPHMTSHVLEILLKSTGKVDDGVEQLLALLLLKLGVESADEVASGSDSGIHYALLPRRLARQRFILQNLMEPPPSELEEDFATNRGAAVTSEDAVVGIRIPSSRPSISSSAAPSAMSFQSRHGSISSAYAVAPVTALEDLGPLGTALDHDDDEHDSSSVRSMHSRAGSSSQTASRAHASLGLATTTVSTLSTNLVSAPQHSPSALASRSALARPMELERLPPYNEAVVGHLLDFIERACIRSHIRSITILTALSMLVDLLHVPSSAIANRRQVLTTEHASTWKRIESAALYRLSSILEDSHGYGYDENDDDDDAGNAIPELLVSAENLVHQFTGEVLPSNDSSSSATPRYPLKDLPCPQRVMNVRRMFANGLLPGGARFRVEHLLFPGSSGTTISSWSDERRLLMAPLLTKWADCVWHAMVLLRSVQWARDELE